MQGRNVDQIHLTLIKYTFNADEIHILIINLKAKNLTYLFISIIYVILKEQARNCEYYFFSHTLKSEQFRKNSNRNTKLFPKFPKCNFSRFAVLFLNAEQGKVTHM